MRKPMANLDVALANVLGAELVENGPEFCSLDHVGQLPAEFANPFDILAQMEKDNGIPLVFDRDIDRAIESQRRQRGQLEQ